MSEEQTQTAKRVRKGTQSCTECRRRKVRCTWASEDSKTCRRCEERDSECTPQMQAAPSVEPRRLTSREKIHILENKLARLTRTVNNIEIKIGSQPSSITNNFASSSSQAVDSEDVQNFNDDSSVSEVDYEDRPTHFQSLFQNEWLSVNTRRQNETQNERRINASKSLLDSARTALQKLIPPRDQVQAIAIQGCASKWLEFLHLLIPQPYVVKSQTEMIASYEGMCRPDADTMALASWLLALALTALQMNPNAEGQIPDISSQFSRVVVDTVEAAILSHDRLIGTVQGLGLAMSSSRIHIFHGHFQKGWLGLRRVIAIAELMGMPQTFQSVQFKTLRGEFINDASLQKAQIWDSICSVDRVAGTILNLPPGTKRYELAKPSLLVINGVVQETQFMSRLVGIGIKTQDLDDMSAMRGLTSELHSFVLDLDRELRSLGAQIPKSWWNEDIQTVEPRHVLQCVYHYVTMRVHLPFTLCKDSGDEFLYSRHAGINACRLLAKRYHVLRRALPSTFFLGRILDIQTFTATVVLLLTSLNTTLPTTYMNASFHDEKSQLDTLVNQVLQLMDENSDTPGLNFARQGATTIRALRALLQQDNRASSSTELTVKVPLLGNVHIRRRASNEFPQPSLLPAPRQQQQEPWTSSEHLAPAQNAFATFPTHIHGVVGTTAAGPGTGPMDWSLYPLSWSIEDNREDFFQDALMAEGFDGLVFP